MRAWVLSPIEETIDPDEGFTSRVPKIMRLYEDAGRAGKVRAKILAVESADLSSGHVLCLIETDDFSIIERASDIAELTDRYAKADGLGSLKKRPLNRRRDLETKGFAVDDRSQRAMIERVAEQLQGRRVDLTKFEVPDI